jgi:ribosomal protein S1
MNSARGCAIVDDCRRASSDWISRGRVLAGGVIVGGGAGEESGRKAEEVVKGGRRQGDTIRAEIIAIDARERKIGLSVKAMLRSEERANIEQYGSSKNATNTLGDILGSKLKGSADKKE